MTTFQVDEALAGERLDAALQGRECAGLGPLSQKKARQLCAVPAVAIDGVLAAGTTRLRQGQVVSFAAEHAVLTLQLGIAVVFDRDGVLVLHKPPGLAVHRGPLVDLSIADLLVRQIRGAGLAHRLDREASGLLLLGRDPPTLRRLGEAMERGDVDREYLAVAVGTIEPDERTIDLPLLVTDEPRGDRPKTIVDPTGAPSRSRVTVLERRGDTSLIRVALDTGRTHQIRAHLAAIGHPLLGDARYGDPAANQRARATFGVHRVLLHSAVLRFPRPDGTVEQLHAAHEPDFARLFRRISHGRADGAAPA